MADVVLDSIGKTYPSGVVAVRDVDLSIADGEFVVLVGPSGCGKSTTLRMIAGLEEITAGTLSIGGSVVNDVAARDRDIAMVFQNYALYPHMSVRRNMAFGLERRREHGSRIRALLSSSYRAQWRAETNAIAERVAGAAETLDIAALLERKPRELSGGQRQRVAVGRALVREPKVFLFDEPLSNLDARLRLETRSELRLLHRRLGATMVYVTHDQEEAMTLGDRLVVMSDARVQQVDTPMDVYARPANRFVAGFVGTPRMNFIEGELVETNGAMQFVARDVRLALPSGLAIAVSRLPGARRVVLGLRPETISLAPAGSSDASIAVVRLVEPLGDRADVTLAMGDHELVVRIATVDAPDEGATTAIAIDASRAHLFTADDEGRRVEPV